MLQKKLKIFSSEMNKEAMRHLELRTLAGWDETIC